jgi:uncharacterized pyridoxamine 5'-phosphate oxidase family protein
MDKKEIVAALQRIRNCSIASIDPLSGEPRVRMINPAIISESEIIFHTGTFKEFNNHLQEKSTVELCFFDNDSYFQIRVRGIPVLEEDNEIKEKILALPQRKFLNDQADIMGRERFLKMFAVYRIPKADAIVWTLKTNNEPNKLVPLYP